MNNINTEEKDIEVNDNENLEVNENIIEPISNIPVLNTNMPELSRSPPIEEINDIIIKDETTTEELTPIQTPELTPIQTPELTPIQTPTLTPSSIKAQEQTPKLILAELPKLEKENTQKPTQKSTKKIVKKQKLLLAELPKLEKEYTKEHIQIQEPENDLNSYISSNKNNIINAPKDDNYNILKQCKIYNINDSNIDFDTNYKSKNFTDKLDYLTELTEKNFEYLQRNIVNLRNEYDHRFDYFKNIKSNNIAGSDDFIFEKEFKLQKNMIQNDLIYIVQSRDIIFLEFYQDLYSIIESLISLELGIDNKKNSKNYEDYKNELLKDIRKNVNMDSEIILELNKLKDILITLVKNIEKGITDLEKFYNSVNKSLNKGVDITSYCISLETTIKKINLELESNKKQTIYQMEDDLVKIHGINAKIDFILDISELSIRKNKKTL